METAQTTTPVVHVGENTKNKSIDYNEDSSYHHRLLVSEYPAGLKVLLVDDDETCLLILRQMLQRCSFRVTTCQRAKDALAMLRDDKSQFDIVVSDVHMPEIDGLKLLKIVAFEMDLPVVLVSSDDDQRLVMEGILGDACDYLIKPITMNNIKTIWQHVVRRRRSKAPMDNSQPLPRLPHPLMNNNSKAELSDKCTVDHNHNNGAAASSDSTISILKKSNDDEQLGREDGGSGSNDDGNSQLTTKRKKRMVWTQDLRNKFVDAINFLGTSSNNNIVPTKILECMLKMGVEGITRENVASHLQKYRMQRRRQQEQQHESLLLHSSSSPDFHHQFHPPFTVGSWGSSAFAPTAINMTAIDEDALVDHHHQINNNINVSHSLPINIRAAGEMLGENYNSHPRVLYDPYFNLQSQLDYQMGIFHENMVNNDALGSADDMENPWQFDQ